MMPWIRTSTCCRLELVAEDGQRLPCLERFANNANWHGSFWILVLQMKLSVRSMLHGPGSSFGAAVVEAHLACALLKRHQHVSCVVMAKREMEWA
eukprot:4993598-Amphidinium_carterae.1